MNNKPMADELWLDLSHGSYLFITKVGAITTGSASEWVWWRNCNEKLDGNSSMEWFLNNCERLTK